MTKHRLQETFPGQDGYYMISTDERDEYSPYKMRDRVGPSKNLNGRYVCLVEGGLVTVWIDGRGPVVGPAFSAEEVPQILNEEIGHSVLYWLGPSTQKPRPCFKCDKPILAMDEDNEEWFTWPDDAASFSTSGHYGCTVIDSIDGDEEINILVCDYCIRFNADRVLEYSLWEGHRENVHTKTEGYRRLKEFASKEIELMEAAGYEWRLYDRDGQRCQDPKKVDPNRSGWFKADAPDSKLDIQRRWAWHEESPELYKQIQQLRSSIFTPHLNPRNEHLRETRRMMRQFKCRTREALEETLGKFSESLRRSIAELSEEESNGP